MSDKGIRPGVHAPGDAEVKAVKKAVSERPVTFGRKHGLGRTQMPTPRQHCQRCAEITERADQIIQNYIIANSNQVQIINRILQDPDATKEVVHAGELLSEAYSFIEWLRTQLVYEEDEHLRTAIDGFFKEVKGDGGSDRGAEGASEGEGEGTSGSTEG